MLKRLLLGTTDLYRPHLLLEFQLMKVLALRDRQKTMMAAHRQAVYREALEAQE